MADDLHPYEEAAAFYRHALGLGTPEDPERLPPEDLHRLQDAVGRDLNAYLDDVIECGRLHDNLWAHFWHSPDPDPGDRCACSLATYQPSPTSSGVRFLAASLDIHPPRPLPPAEVAPVRGEQPVIPRGPHARLYEGMTVRLLPTEPVHDDLTVSPVRPGAYVYCPVCATQATQVVTYRRESSTVRYGAGFYTPPDEIAGHRIDPCRHYVTAIGWYATPSIPHDVRLPGFPPPDPPPEPGDPDEDIQP